MLALDNLSFAFNGRAILNKVSFRLASGEMAALLGVNGSGKSTLLKTINGILKPKEGAVLVEGVALHGLSGREIAKRIGYMPQKSSGTACTVFDAVLLGRKPHFDRSVTPHDLAAVERVLKRLGLEKLALRETAELSGGELQKVVIARALVQEPKVLLLDEPVNHLDIRNQLETMSILREITREMNLLTITVLHDLTIALRYVDRFVLLKDGALHACGDRRVMTPEAIREVFGMHAVIREIDGIPVVLPLGSATC
ncbi:MAG: iron complex transport system ATP-binding protein [Candidatus Electronema aureum]|uniref:Iron complex transport system ATP-binding protein n=1 Tax=Candidatus Electronema aureum TaxID=2005002 RepID=A0A521G3R1_9BACT|nr:MAG: iron complex transport system ATP-binding protein [Candidatus Electronema aureum]